jgi:hypothetical protein
MNGTSDPPVIIADGSLDLGSNKNWATAWKNVNPKERKYPSDTTPIDSITVESPALNGGSLTFLTYGNGPVKVTVFHPDTNVEVKTNNGNAKIHVKLTKVAFSAFTPVGNGDTISLGTNAAITGVLIEIGNQSVGLSGLTYPTTVTMSDNLFQMKKAARIRAKAGKGKSKAKK